MRQCPLCNRTYDNDNDVFCYEDGTRLSAFRDGDATIVAEPEINTLIRNRAGKIEVDEFCPRCGNRTTQTLLHFYDEPDSWLPLYSGYFILYETGLSDYGDYNLEYEIESAKKARNFNRIWPRSSVWIENLRVPEVLKQRYLALLRHKGDGDLFASRVIKLLDSICDDKGVPLGTLHIRLTGLVASQRLPAAIGEWLQRIADIDVVVSRFIDEENLPQTPPFDYLVLELDEFFSVLMPLLYPSPQQLFRNCDDRFSER